LYFVPPGGSGFYPPCQFHLITGLHCPGCGTTRCLSAFVHGDFAQAAAYNVVSLFLMPAATAWLFFGWFQVLRGRPFPVWFFTPLFLRWFVIMFLAFGVLRNLPLYPFTLLAPHTLTASVSRPAAE